MTRTVLLVEDVEDNRELARLLLEGEGFEVIEAFNGAEAVAMASQQPLTMILMDLSLPVMDGWEAARQIRDNPATRHVPIVAITAHAMSGDQERVLAAGFQGYIPKPLDVSAFPRMIAAILEG